MIETSNEQKRYPLQMGGGGRYFCRDCPYKILKRKSIEKKLTCFLCGFVYAFLKLLFYAKQHCFALQETHSINSQPSFLRLSILNAFLAILEAHIFTVFQGSACPWIPQKPRAFSAWDIAPPI